jgi:lysyl-tRNA synthetase class 2
VEEQSQVRVQRMEKIRQMREKGVEIFPNDFNVVHTTREIIEMCDSRTDAELEKTKPVFVLAGRMISLRQFGKASFFHLQDRKGQIQAYIKKDQVGDDTYGLFRSLDVGDFVGITGPTFRTKTGERTIAVQTLRLLAKSVRPLPEKFHKLRDTETRYRQRYVDLIVNNEVKEIFIKRTRIIQALRAFLNEREFLEVETPMMQPIPGGATARPFRTYHNALDMELFLRIAPELYLKRLVVGGLERVYEINRNFRNEGISTQHNPEFTMLELYMSYATYEDLMDLTEEMICRVCQEIGAGSPLVYQGQEISLDRPWQRLSVKEAVARFGGVDRDVLEDREKAVRTAIGLGCHVTEKMGLGKAITQMLDHLVEPHLIHPTFVTHFPTDVSPLSRRNDQNPEVTDRFELYMAGREIVNGFSELNDPFDQRERFRLQVQEREAGDEEAHLMDEDYIRALEYGMPPTAGLGLGVDRLVMILGNVPSIRDVILFPHLRPEKSHS